MTTDIATRSTRTTRQAEFDPGFGHVPGIHDGWQALAVASLGRPFTDVELAAAEHLPVEVALDLFFPHLDDAARHEALSTLA